MEYSNEKPLRLLSLFSGVGAFEEALKNLKVPVDVVNYCEFKPFIANAYSLIHNVPIEKNLGDITKVDEDLLPDDIDLMTFGFPCQCISGLGNQDGLFFEDGTKTRSGLVFDAIRIARKTKPKYMILENVRDLVGKKFINDFKMLMDIFDEMGYNHSWKVINTKNFGIPHSRNRVYVVFIRKDIDDNNFMFHDGFDLNVKATEMTEKYSDEDVYTDERHEKYYNDFRLKKKYSSINSDIMICMTTKGGGKTNAQNFIKDEKGVRIMTSGEYFLFQGFDPKYGKLLLDNGYTHNKIGYMLGNSISVNVLEMIFTNLLNIC